MKLKDNISIILVTIALLLYFLGPDTKKKTQTPIETSSTQQVQTTPVKTIQKPIQIQPEFIAPKGIPVQAVQGQQGALQADELNNIQIFNNNALSVVNVSNFRVSQNPFNNRISSNLAGSGSGFVWSDQGHIVTNYHVVQGGDRFYVSFHKDSNKYEATVIGSAPNKDLAVLQLKEFPPKLIPLKVGSSALLAVGQKAIAIGNPFGLDHTMTTGIVSALDRTIESQAQVEIRNVIQTDAAINPGNSGGPLLDSSGNLIGVNTAIYSNSGSSAGIGFAVPVDTVKRVIPQLIAHGKEVTPSIGIYLLREDLKAYFNVKKGLVIRGIVKDSSAEKAGLKGIQQDQRGRIYLGDVILAVEGKEINNYNDIYHTLSGYKVGDTVELTYQRKDKLYKTKIKLMSNAQ